MKTVRDLAVAWLLLLPGIANSAVLAEHYDVPALISIPVLAIAGWSGWAWIAGVGGGR